MKPNIRIGYGYDVHALAEGVDFWLGEIQIPHTHGAFGHSILGEAFELLR